MTKVKKYIKKDAPAYGRIGFGISGMSDIRLVLYLFKIGYIIEIKLDNDLFFDHKFLYITL